MNSFRRKHLPVTNSSPRRIRAWYLPLVLVATLLGLSTATNAADEKASKFYEDALVRFERKDLDGAIIQLKNALQIDKNMLPVQVLLGKALLKNGDVIGFTRTNRDEE